MHSILRVSSISLLCAVPLAAQGLVPGRPVPIQATQQTTAPYAALTNDLCEVANFNPEPYAGIAFDVDGGILAVNPYNDTWVKYAGPSATQNARTARSLISSARHRSSPKSRPAWGWTCRIGWRASSRKPASNCKRRDFWLSLSPSKCVCARCCYRATRWNSNSKAGNGIRIERRFVQVAPDSRTAHLLDSRGGMPDDVG